MPSKKTPAGNDKLQQAIDESRQDLARRQTTYRERALKLFPWICARCGREFSGKKLRELTVHHKDHDHNNNPPDGSNWELLCLYCHENEHSRLLDAEWHAGTNFSTKSEATSTHRPFADLADLLKDKKS